MLRTITGLFDSRAEAQAVMDHLVKHDKLDTSRIRMHGSDESAPAGAAASDDKGFWASLKDLFVPDEDRYAYSEGIRRGGVVVSAEIEEAQLEHAMDVFEEHGAVDLDAREAEWRTGGWTGYNATAVAGTGTMAGTAAGMIPVAATPVATGTMATGTAAPMAGTRTGGVDVGNQDVIPIVEERIRVGKRAVEGGRVRVRSFIVETPVSEQVQLHEERVSIERRPVNRPLTDADNAFRERTIEAVEHTEEAVVAKEARVTEELVLRKDATERTETVTDTVRRQEVEIDDGRVERTAAERTAAPMKPVAPKV